MPLNLLKQYPELLDLNMNEADCINSLLRIFRRDIEENVLQFQNKSIRPIKGEEPSMQILFKHLTCEEIQMNENGNSFKKRIFDKTRSERLHWIKPHILIEIKDLSIFSCEERDQKKRKDIIRTYIYNKDKKYIIVLEPQRSKQDYYLLTAYYINKDFGEKNIMKKLKKKLNYVA